jgi:HlyD family secretion protein
MMKRLIWAAAVVVAVGSGFAVVTLADAESTGRYRVATATIADVEQTVTVSGTVDHVNRADVAFGGDGTVGSLVVAPGDQVSAGQVLGALETASLQAAVDRAAAELADAEAALSAAEAAASSAAASESASESSSESSSESTSEPSAGSPELAAAQDAADAALATASDALAAQQAACADPAAAACVSAVSATAAAQEAVRAAQDILQREILESAESAKSEQSAESEQPAGSVADGEAAVAEASMRLTEAQQALAGSTLTSPIAGTVASVTVTVGDGVTAGQAVAVVVGEGAATVTATVPVEQISTLAVGRQAVVTPLGTSTRVPGTVTRVAALPDAVAEEVAYPVTITVPTPPPTMAAGSSATATITTATAEDVLTVPTSAIHGAGRPTVTVLTGTQTTMTPVTLGAVGPTRTEIKEGLTAGTQVVLADLDAPLPTSDQQTNPMGPKGLTDKGGGPVVRMRPIR